MITQPMRPAANTFVLADGCAADVPTPGAGHEDANHPNRSFESMVLVCLMAAQLTWFALLGYVLMTLL